MTAALDKGGCPKCGREYLCIGRAGIRFCRYCGWQNKP